MTDPQLPSEHAGQPVCWGPWSTTAVCGRERLPHECQVCHEQAVHEGAQGTVGGGRAFALRCPLCGVVEARWRDETSGKAIVTITGRTVPDAVQHWQEQP